MKQLSCNHVIILIIGLYDKSEYMICRILRRSLGEMEIYNLILSAASELNKETQFG